MSHVLKIFRRSLHQKIYKKIEENTEETQLKFRKSLGTRELLFNLQILTRCRDVNSKVFLCFFDLEKAFDNIHYNKILEIIRNAGTDEILDTSIYWEQTRRQNHEGRGHKKRG